MLNTALALVLVTQSLEEAKWIWGGWTQPGERPVGETCSFRRTLVLESQPARAIAAVTADNHFKLSVNGVLMARGDDWQRAARVDLAAQLRAGENVLTADCRNDGSPAGFLFAVELEWKDGRRESLVSDATWLTAPKASGAADTPVRWLPALELGAYGMAPWGRIGLGETSSCRADPLPGWRVAAVVEGIGSIDTFTVVEHGRLIASVEGGGLLELRDLDGDPDGTTESASVFTDAIEGCQGMLWHDESLYVTGFGPGGQLGLYRIHPAPGEGGSRAPPELVLKLAGDGGEHGPHALVLGPDGWIYVVIGNHAQLAAPASPDSPYRLTYEGHLLPTYVDPRGHAVHCKAPGGFIARVDPKTRECQLFAAGFRNSYDAVFDEQGRLYTYDSDMEWDVGLPWYRPVRLLHVVAGGEYGWRTGSSCWPESHEDSLPSAIDMGRGSPTGMCLVTGDRFPARLRGAILAGDWSLGQIVAFHVEPRGASVAATSEVLLRGHPLNVTDLEMDEDGSLLFSVGGRGTQGGIHRLVYAGDAEGGASKGEGEIRVVPRFDDKTLLSVVFGGLGSDDRFVRFAAGRELERRDPASFESKALALADPLSRAGALIALARAGYARADGPRLAPRLEAAMEALSKSRQEPTLPGAAKAPEATPSMKERAATARLALLRALDLLLQDPEIAAAPAPIEGEPLLALFPCGDRAADRELALLLARLAPEGAVAELLAAFESEPSREQKIAYAYALRAVRDGWPEGARLELSRWLERAIASWAGGASFEGYLRRIRDDVAAGLTESERATLAAEKAASRAGPVAIAASAAEPRDLDRTFEVVDRTLRSPRRSLADGALVYQQLCANCHRRFETGASVGPDLTTIGARFGLRDLLESMVVPSRTVSDQYRGMNVFLKSGDIQTGLPVVDDGNSLVLVGTRGERIELAADAIASRRPATKSVMPDALLDPLTLEQVADLCAYLLADRPVTAASAPTWRPLFDGSSLAGFEGESARWRVESGVIAGEGEGLPTPSHLVLSEPLSDFVLEFELGLAAASERSGVLFRGGRSGNRLTGYVADGGQRNWGTLLEEGGRGVLARPASEIWTTLADPTGWNHYVITAAGPRVTIELNGLTTVDFEDPEGPREGLLAFTLPSGSPSHLRVRHVRVRNGRTDR